MTRLPTLAAAALLAGTAGAASAVTFNVSLGPNEVAGFDLEVTQAMTPLFATTQGETSVLFGAGDTYLSLFDGPTLIAADDDGGTGFYSLIALFLEPGLYSLFVTGYGNVPSDGPTFLENADPTPAGEFTLTIIDREGLSVTEQTPVVPLPASVPLLAGALGALGALSLLRRRRRA